MAAGAVAGALGLGMVGVSGDVASMLGLTSLAGVAGYQTVSPTLPTNDMYHPNMCTRP